MQNYQFKTPPYAHQLTVFNLCKDLKNYALFLEMGAGKTKIAIDKAAYLFENKKINSVLIVAPKGVHQNWIDREIPTHNPDRIKTSSLLWSPKKSFEKEFNFALSQKNTLFYFSINIDAFNTIAGKKYIKQFLQQTNALMIVDESSRIKNPSAQRTKSVILFGKLAPYKLILTGTPVSQSPFDIYAQFKFLDPDILNYPTFTAFRHEFGIFERKVNPSARCFYDVLIKYKNLDVLQKLIEEHSYRITKKECLDLPDKIYKRYTVDLNTEQKIHYQNLQKHLITLLKNEEITTPIAITQLLKLQQITGGFLLTPTQDSSTPVAIPIGHNNPKIDLLLELLEDLPDTEKVIIWARFTHEIERIKTSLQRHYATQDIVVTYYGDTSNDDREAAINRFQTDPGSRFFIGNPKAAGLGLTLTAASTVVYFSNDFSLETRLQSEDRAHRIGQKNNVVYIDLEVPNSIDTKIIDALRNKKNVADYLTKDNVSNFLQHNE